MAPIFSFPAQVNERAARLVAFGALALALASIASGSRWLPWLLAGGFLLRLGWGPRFSPLGRLAVWLALRIAPPRPVPGPPKRFAQGIGAAVTLAAATLFALGHPVASAALLGVLAVFAALEAVFAFCFGCWIHGRLQRIGWIAADVCVTCAPVPYGANECPENQ